MGLKRLRGGKTLRPGGAHFCVWFASCRSPPGAGEGRSCNFAVGIESEMLFHLGPSAQPIHSLGGHLQTPSCVLGTASGVRDVEMSQPFRNYPAVLLERVVPGAVGMDRSKAAWWAVMEGGLGSAAELSVGTVTVTPGYLAG